MLNLSKLVLLILAMLLFFLAMISRPTWPDRVRLVAAGLFCYTLMDLIIRYGGK